MGCFSISAHKTGKKMTNHSQLPMRKSANLYDNKPTVLPDPCEVEQGRYTRTFSSSFQFINVRRSQTSKSQSIFKAPRALSAPDRLHMLDSCSHYRLDVPDAHPSSSPMRNRIQPFLDPSFCPKADRVAFAGRPVPLPAPQLPKLSVHPLPIVPSSSDSLIAEQSSFSSTEILGSSSKCLIAAPTRQWNGRNAQVLLVSSSLEPKPLPLPPNEANSAASSPRLSTVGEVAASCRNFSPHCCPGNVGAGVIYRSWIFDKQNAKKKTEVSVVQITPPSFLQDSSDFIAEATRLSSLRHPNLCNFIGFCVEDAIQLPLTSMKQKVRHLLYERLPNGTADKLLYRGQEGASLDWPTRLKIALGAAKGLTYLHEHPSGQILCRCFSTSNIELDQDFSAKLSCYGFVDEERFEFNHFGQGTAYILPEAARDGRVSLKSNVYSFGIVMLELLRGRRKVDAASPSKEQNLVNWSARFADDERLLFCEVDPALKGCYSPAELKSFAKLAQTCVNEEPDLRPSMQEVAQTLASLEVTASSG